MAIDLHTHSTASDGTLTPEELVREALAAGLSAVALTDHDTVAGVDAFVAAAQGTPLRAIPGVEIAASWYGGSLHLVGLFIDPREPELLAMLTKVRADREIRNHEMARRLNQLGIPITYEEVWELAGEDLIGRPHFAAALVRRGVCATLGEAFARFLAVNQAAYVRRYLPLPPQAIAAIHRAGGVAVMAHPLGGIDHMPAARLRSLVRRVAALGADAIETVYSDHTPEDVQVARRIAAELNLAESGGSDFHGDNLAGVAIGSGHGDMVVPDSFLPALEARASRWRQGAGGA